MTEPPSVLITGAGSGLGLESAFHLASREFRVYGAAFDEREAQRIRDESGRRGVSVHPVRLDITDHGQVAECVAEVMRNARRIDALVHFAGLGLRGFFEDLDMDEIRRVYEVNVFGTMTLTQAVLPQMRAQSNGRIIVTTSAAGRMGAMSISGYSSSKFALEGWGECLAPEVRPFGIHVSMLEPGLIATPHFQHNRNRARRAVLPSSPYYKWFVQHEHIVDRILERAQFTAVDVARLVHRILTDPHPKLRYMIGRKAKLLTALRRYTPGDLFDRIYWPLVQRVVTSPRQQAPGFSETLERQ